MFILENTPTHWKMHAYLWDDGRVQVLTGNQERVVRLAQNPSRHPPGARLAVIENFLFRASIRIAAVAHTRNLMVFEYADSDGLNTYHTGPAMMRDFMRFIESGWLRAGGGWVHGVFTFIKTRNHIYIKPVRRSVHEAVCAAHVHLADDVSDGGTPGPKALALDAPAASGADRRI